MISKKKSFYGGIFAACIVAVILVANNTVPLHKANTQSSKTYIETILTPAEIGNNYKNDPYVRIHPSNVLYPLIRFVESLQHPRFGDGRFELGRKRVAELLAWGESIPSSPISIHKDPQETAHEINENRRAKWDTYLTLQATWESLLSDYMQECEYATDSHNSNLDQPWHLESILYAIRRDERLLLGSINNPGIAIKNRNYIYIISNATFSYCKQQLETIDYSTDPYTQNYLSPQSTAGEVKPFITVQSAPYATNVRLSVNNRPLTHQLQEGKAAWSRAMPFSLQTSDRTIQTQIQAEPITQLNRWEKAATHAVTTFETSITIPQDLLASRLLFSIANISPEVKAIQIWKDSELYNPIQNTNVQHTEFFPPYHLHSHQTSYKTILYELPNERVTTVHVRLAGMQSDTPIPKISVTALYRPSILLAGDVRVSTPDSYVSKVRQWISSHYKTLLGINALYVIILLALQNRFIKQALNNATTALLNTKTVFIYLLPITALLVLCDVLLTSKHVTIYLFVLAPFGLTLYILRPSGKTLSQHILILFILALLSFVAKQPATDALFRWGYLYLCAAVFFTSQNLVAKNPTLNFPSPIWHRLYTSILSFIRYAYTKIFHVPPKRTFDYLYNAFITSLILVICVSAVLLLRKLNAITANYNRIPTITNVELTDTYPGTIIVVRGEHFGWNTDQNSRIMSVYGDMHILDWKDTKVVFQIPPNTHPGKMWIQIGKYDVWFNEVKLLTSKQERINVISTGQKWREANDNYLKQLYDASAETKQLNGAPKQKP